MELESFSWHRRYTGRSPTRHKQLLQLDEDARIWNPAFSSR